MHCEQLCKPKLPCAEPLSLALCCVSEIDDLELREMPTVFALLLSLV